MKRRLIPLLLVFSITNVAAGQIFDQVSIKFIRDSIQNILERYDVPGAGVAITCKDSLIWADGIGVADMKTKKPVNSHTLFRVASITKSFLSIGILKLVEEGKLQLDAKLSDLIPEIKIENPWEKTDPVRLVNVLEHTAGFDDMHFNEFYSPGGKILSAKEILEINPASRRVRWRPGTRMSYSNPGYAVAGYLLEKFTGERYEEYLKELILIPLGMNDGTFDRSEIEPGKVPIGYEIIDGNAVAVGYREVSFRWAGSLNASASDMAGFVRFLLNRGWSGESQTIDTSLVFRMETHTTSYASEKGLKGGYGLANMISVKGNVISYGHSGGIDGFISKYRYFPSVGLGFVVLLNMVSNEAYKEISDLLQNYLTKDMKQKAELSANSYNAKDYKKLAGYYSLRNPRNDIFSGPARLLQGIRIINKGDTIYSKMFMQDHQVMIPVSDHIFRYKGYCDGHLYFGKNGNGQLFFVNSNLGEDYYEKRSLFIHSIALCSFIISIVVMLLIVPVSIGWWISYLFKKVKNVIFLDHSLFLLAIVALIATLLSVSNLQLSQLYQIGMVSFRTVTFFFGTIIFAILSAGGIYFVFRYSRKRRGFNKYYMVLTATAFAVALIFCISWNIIGLRLWAY